MSVLIKGMKMPKNCMECPFKGFDRAKGKGNICTIDEEISLHAVLEGLDVKFVKMGDCPLIELPDHGDLIDRDALKADLGITDWECDKCQWGGLFGCKRDDFSDACFFLENAEAVIPAERSEEC